MKPEHVEPPQIPASTEPVTDAGLTSAGPASEASAASAASVPASSDAPWLLRGVGVVAVIGAVGMGLMWSKLNGIQEQLALQSADTGSKAVEAKAASKQAEELARETAARLAVTDAKLSEVALQRTQLEELM